MNKKLSQYEPIVDLLDEIFGDHRTHNEFSGQLTYCCPVCSYEIKGLDKPDDKFNLEINYILGVAKCWSCSETHDTHGRLHKFVKKHGTHRQLKKFELLMPETEFEIEKKIYHRVKLPKEYISFKNVSNGLKLTHYYKRPYNYLKERNVTDEMIERFHIGFCYEGKYANRIIIPSYDAEGIVNYFVARSYETRPYRKYDNPEAEKQAIIFNEYLIDWDDPIYLVEGVFDSIFIPNSISMLGKKMSDLLFDTLYEKAKKIVIILDPDAWEDAQKLYHKLNGGKLFNKIWIVKLEGQKIGRAHV